MRIPTSFLWQSQDYQVQGESALIPENPRGVPLEWSRLPPVISVNPPLVEIYQERWQDALLVTYDDLTNNDTQSVHHLLVRDTLFRDALIARVDEVDTVKRQPRPLGIEWFHEPLQTKYGGVRMT